jgi:hypothetical protein
VIAAFLAASAIGLGRFPAAHEDEWFGAPGYELLTHGRYALPLFAGFAGSDQHAYFFMPLASLFAGGMFKLLGLGLWQARAVTVLLAGLAMALTYALGRRCLSPAHGALAVAVLALVPVAAAMPYYPSGIPLFDLARHARYDLGAAVFGLWATLVGARDWTGFKRGLYAGVLVGLAVLCHVYGGLFGLALLVPSQRERPPGFVAARVGLVVGTLLPLALYVAFVATGWGDFLAQSRVYAGRFSLGSVWFYLRNLATELRRYSPMWGARATPAFWLYLGAVVAGAVSLLRAWRDPGSAGKRHILKTVVVVALGMALFVSPKPWVYLAVLWPLYALLAAEALLRLAARLPMTASVRWGAAAVLFAALAAPAAGRMVHGVLTTTPYAAWCRTLSAPIPTGSHVMAHHRYWMGLASRFPDMRSTIAPLMRCMPRTSPTPESCDAAYEDGWADYFLFGAPEADLVAGKDAFPEYRDGALALERLRRTHQPPVAVFDDPTYGRVELLRMR